jgi:hypothetical protein
MGLKKRFPKLRALFHEIRAELRNARERLLGFPEHQAKFLEIHGYPLNLKDPRSYSEKVIWKKIHDRNPLLPIVSDKYRVRAYLRERLGEAEADDILIPLLHVSKRPEDIPFDKLPPSYVVKINHGSGWNIIVRDRDKSPKEIVEQCREWLDAPYGNTKYEWGYQSIPRLVIVESFLSDPDGRAPKDYKFFIFHGRCAFIKVDVDRFEEHTQTLYDRDWNELPVRLKFPQGPSIPKPAAYDRMLALAERLSAEFDFVRVDLYTLGDRIYFGELTHYPGSGLEPFTPSAYDFTLGTHWKLRKHYWKKTSP